MKAFLLAAGLGTRLRPLTDRMPKCLLPVQGIPMLKIWFALCERFGVDEVLINVHSHAEAVRNFVEENKGTIKACVSEETALLGSAGTILANRDWVNKENSFWVFYADVLTTTNLKRMLEFHNSRGQVATIGVYEVPDPSRCGIVQVDNHGVVRDFVEKPQAPNGNLAFSGLMLATPALFEVIPETTPVDLGLHILPQIVGRMVAYRISDFIIDIGTLDTYRAAQIRLAGTFSTSKNGVNVVLKGVVFDFDGVLVDSHPVHLRAWKKFFESIGAAVSDEHLQFVLDGRRRDDILRHFLGDICDETLVEFGHRKEQFFRNEATDVQLIEGLLSFLEDLEGAQLNLSVASSGSRSRIAFLLKNLDLEKYFRAVITGDEVPRGKPDPAVFLRAARDLGVEPFELVAFEDAFSGVKAAKSAGMTCIGIAPVSRGSILLDAGAIHVVPDFSSLSYEKLRELLSNGVGSSPLSDSR